MSLALDGRALLLRQLCNTAELICLSQTMDEKMATFQSTLARLETNRDSFTAATSNSHAVQVLFARLEIALQSTNFRECCTACVEIGLDLIESIWDVQLDEVDRTGLTLNLDEKDFHIYPMFKAITNVASARCFPHFVENSMNVSEFADFILSLSLHRNECPNCTIFNYCAANAVMDFHNLACVPSARCAGLAKLHAFIHRRIWDGVLEHVE
jgi:hypothetical protein